MRLIGIESVVGGAGATSIAAGTVCALNDRGMRAIALDLNAANQLGLHFGMPLTQGKGICGESVPVGGLEQVLCHNSDGYPYIPFGNVAPALAKTAGDRLSRVLTGILKPLFAVREQFLVVDVPRHHAALRDWVYVHADLVLNVVQPEPRAVPALLRHAVYQRRGQLAAHGSSLVLFNGVAPHLTLPRDTLDVLRAQIAGDAQCPVLIHRDPHITEAFAAQVPVRTLAPSAQGTEDFTALAAWALSWFGDGDPGSGVGDPGSGTA